MTHVVMFPGQGSQKKGMGAGLFEKYSQRIREAEDILGYSIEELCLKDSESKLDRTEHTQPAIFVVNALAYEEALEGGMAPPDYLVGHSLGEYNALLAAGSFDFRTGLSLVRERARFMAQETEGAMAAVVGLETKDILNLFWKNNIRAVDIANKNSPVQSVLSGPAEDIDGLGPVLEKNGARLFVKLKVSGAFHSRYMRRAKEAFAAILKGASFNPPTIPVFSNVTGRLHETEDIRRNLADQITSPVRWLQTIRHLLNQPDPRFTEVGDSRVLTGLIKQMAPSAS